MKFYKKLLTSSKGVTLIETILGLAMFSISLFLFYLIFFSFRVQSEAETKRLNIERIGLGIQKTSLTIVDIFTNICTNSPGSNFAWGWRHPNCSSTSIFPNLSSSGNSLVLTYNYNGNSLSIDQLNTLRTEIATNFNFCIVNHPSNTQTVITCPFAINARYCLSTSTDCNNVSQTTPISPHTAGQSYNYITNRIISLIVEYDDVGPKGDIIQHRIGNTAEYNKPYFIDFGSYYMSLLEKNKQKYIDIYNALRKYEITRRVVESQNSAPTGLNEVDDYFIPWVFQITANSLTNANTSCNNSSCSNIFSPDYWNTTLTSTNMLTYTLNTINYLLGNTRSYMIDVFGNPIGIELLVDMSRYNGTTCRSLYSPTVGSNCLRVNPLPPSPRPNYASVWSVRPPFIGYIYADFCHDLSNTQFDSCRMVIVYVN